MKLISGYLLVLLPISVLVPWAPFVGPINTNDILPLVAGGVASWLLVAKRPVAGWFRFPWTALVLFGMAMLGAHALGEQSALSLGTSGRTLGRMGLYAVLGAAISTCLKQSDLVRLGNIYVALVLAEAGIGVAAVLSGYSGPLGVGVVSYPPGHFPIDGWARAQGTFGGVVPASEAFVNRANFYSAYLVSGLFVVLDRYRHRPKHLLFAVALILGGILASGSRMSLIAAVVGIAVFMMVSGQIRILGAGLFAAGLGLMAYAPLRQRFFNLSTDRFELWQNAIDVAASAPWLGVGDGRYLEVARQVAESPSAIAHSPHHSVLYAAASYGIPVALGLVLIYGLLTWKAFEARHDRPALVAMTVAFILHDMTNNLFFIPEVALSFWIAWAYLSAKATIPND